MFNRKPRDPKTPVIRSKRDLVAHLGSVVNDAQVASLIGDVLERTGLDGRIEIKRGGQGQPYAVEYPAPQRMEKPTNVLVSEIEHFKKLVAQAASDSEKDWWRQQLAEAMGLIAVIWIQTDSQDAFDAKRQLVARAHQLGVQVSRQAVGKT